MISNHFKSFLYDKHKNICCHPRGENKNTIDDYTNSKQKTIEEKKRNEAIKDQKGVTVEKSRIKEQECVIWKIVFKI